ncbi:uncharacterized protein LOC119683967 isoform X2 [Teleopsis dalmanni]|uniref:uncharacterized protein LOC119683967 isoform X2 n=1 Tax=Teleopsis dalmanni TaxID=139649 RepID=UPI0018CDC8D7|nr:uncharacterized protein LOC119683967 isoform X2 [Teleopsis dalmanni]
MTQFSILHLYASDELEKNHEKAAKKWGFDFRNGMPIKCNSHFVWERVTFQEATNSPEMYTLTRAAHVRPVTTPPTPIDLLIDERAERENFISSATDTDSCDESQDEATVTFKVPTIVGHSNKTTKITLPSSKPNLRKRQPKITEYMKERKRLAQTPKKMSPPSKRMRTSSGSGVSSSTNSHLSQMFGFSGNITFKRSYAK